MLARAKTTSVHTSRSSERSTGRAVLSPFAEILAAFERAARDLGVRWYLFGAQAAILHGASRLTADVDVTVALGAHTSQELVSTLRRESFVLRVEDVDAFVERTRVIPFRHEPSRIDLDVVLAGPGPEELFLARSEMRDVEGSTIPVARAEDVLVMKILAGRPKDREDVAQILVARGDTLDIAMTRSTLGLLEKALDQSDLLPEFERALVRARRGPA